MPSSVARTENDDVRAVAATLLGVPVDTVIPARAGGNNRVFRANCRGGVTYAMKFYPCQPGDTRDRLGVEWNALTFLSGHGIDDVPHPRAKDPERRVAMFQWIEGERATTNADAVAELAAFLVKLTVLVGEAGANSLPAASAACFSAAAVVAQLHERRRHLDGPAQHDAALADFLLQAFDPACGSVIEKAQNGFAQRRWDFAALLPPARRILSPSDFGLHNTLRRPDGRLAFIDFEYFGWDDPVKAVADVMLHAGMDLPTDLAVGFLESVRPIFARHDDRFEMRLRLLYPLYALIWCLIVLNEFVPDRWARRAWAGAGADRQALQSRQLQRARIRLARLKDIDDGFAIDT